MLNDWIDRNLSQGRHSVSKVCKQETYHHIRRDRTENGQDADAKVGQGLVRFDVLQLLLIQWQKLDAGLFRGVYNRNAAVDAEALKAAPYGPRQRVRCMDPGIDSGY